MIVIGFDVSCATCGRPDAVTTTASSTPATSSCTSSVDGRCAATVTERHHFAGAGIRRFRLRREDARRQGVDAIFARRVGRRAAEPSSRAARTLAPTMAPCGSVTRPRSERSAPPWVSPATRRRQRDRDRRQGAERCRAVSTLTHLAVRSCARLVLREADDERRQTGVSVEAGGGAQVPAHAFCSPQKVSRMNAWVGLLAWRGQDV